MHYFARKNELVKAVLTSMPQFVLTNSEFQRHYRSYKGWNSLNYFGFVLVTKKGMFLLSWGCGLQNQGGLGVRRLNRAHEVVMGKHLHKVVENLDTHWTQVIKAKYSCTADVWANKKYLRLNISN